MSGLDGVVVDAVAPRLMVKAPPVPLHGPNSIPVRLGHAASRMVQWGGLRVQTHSAFTLQAHRIPLAV